MPEPEWDPASAIINRPEPEQGAEQEDEGQADAEEGKVINIFLDHVAIEEATAEWLAEVSYDEDPPLGPDGLAIVYPEPDDPDDDYGDPDEPDPDEPDPDEPDPAEDKGKTDSEWDPTDAIIGPGHKS